MSSESLYKLFIAPKASFRMNGISTQVFQSIGDFAFYQEGVHKAIDQSISVLTLNQLVACTYRHMDIELFFAQVTLCEDSVVAMKSLDGVILSPKFTGDKLVRYTNSLDVGKIRPIDELFVDLNPQTLLDCIRLNSHLLKYIPGPLLTTELCCAAVAEYPQHLALVPEEIKTENYPMCLGAVTRYGSLLKLVPLSIHTPELYRAALGSDISALEFIPAEGRTYELYLAVMKGNYYGLNGTNRSRFVPQCFQTREMCWAMVGAIIREMKNADCDSEGVTDLVDDLNEILERLEKGEKTEKGDERRE